MSLADSEKMLFVSWLMNSYWFDFFLSFHIVCLKIDCSRLCISKIDCSQQKK